MSRKHVSCGKIVIQGYLDKVGRLRVTIDTPEQTVGHDIRVPMVQRVQDTYYRPVDDGYKTKTTGRVDKRVT